MDELKSLIASIEDEDYRKVCQIFLEQHYDAWKNTPAAKSVHHGFLSGLLMHTTTMMKIADFLAGHH